MNPTRVSLSRFADSMCVALATKFCPRRVDVAAVPRQQGKPWAAERLEKTTIGEAVARHQIEGAAKRGVAADVEMIGPVALRRRGHVVADLGRTVRTRIERRNRTADRMRQRWRKRVAGRIGRHRRDARQAFIRPRRLVVGKEERAVPDDGPADGESGLRALVLRIGLALRREIIRRVECAVTEERVRSTVQLIRARFHHHAHLRRALPAERGFGRAREHLEFLDRVDRRPVRPPY